MAIKTGMAIYKKKKKKIDEISSSSQFDPGECGDRKLFTTKLLNELTKA
jgi:hypothetical protein